MIRARWKICSLVAERLEANRWFIRRWVGVYGSEYFLLVLYVRIINYFFSWNQFVEELKMEVNLEIDVQYNFWLSWFLFLEPTVGDAMVDLNARRDSTNKFVCFLEKVLLVRMNLIIWEMPILIWIQFFVRTTLLFYIMERYNDIYMIIKDEICFLSKSQFVHKNFYYLYIIFLLIYNISIIY